MEISNMKTHSLNRYRQIEFATVEALIRQQGWQEVDRKDGVIAIWGVEKPDGLHRLILPLDQELPDYPYKMFKALETIADVENRDQDDILDACLDSSILATEENREFMDLRLLPTSRKGGSPEFPAKHLGFILSSLQNLIDAIGKAEDGAYSSSRISGLISKSVTDRTKLSVVGTAPGSFVVKLAGEVPPAQGNVLDQLNGALEQRSLKSFLELIRISHAGDMDGLTEILRRLQKRTVVTYRKFLSSVSSSDSGFDVRLGSSNVEACGKALLNATEIPGLIEFLKKIEPQTPERIRVDGKMKMIAERKNSKALDFRLYRNGDNQEFTGKIPADVIKQIDDRGIELTRNREYMWILEETELTDSVTGDSKMSYRLMDIDYLENAPADSEDTHTDVEEEDFLSA
jgi:hypothetical protein